MERQGYPVPPSGSYNSSVAPPEVVYSSEPAKESGTSTWVIVIVIIIIIIILLIIGGVIWNSNCKKNCTTTMPPEEEIIPQPNLNCMKVVALLDITGQCHNSIDQGAAIVLHEYNQNHNADMHVEIKDTKGDLDRTIALFEEAILRGHRKFIIGSSHHILQHIVCKINDRSDVVFISIGSNPASFNMSDKIFRLIKYDSSMIPNVPDYLSCHYKIIYILQEDDFASRELTKLMQHSLECNGTTVKVITVNCETSARHLYPQHKCEREDVAVVSILNCAMYQHIYSQMYYCNYKYKNYAISNQLVTTKTSNLEGQHLEGQQNCTKYHLEGRACNLALETNLEVIAFSPFNTVESNLILSKINQAINPLSLTSWDAANALNNSYCRNDKVREYLNKTAGVTGPLAVDAQGDRIYGPFVSFIYNSDKSWTPNIIFGNDLKYGNYSGQFGNNCTKNCEKNCESNFPDNCVSSNNCASSDRKNNSTSTPVYTSNHNSTSTPVYTSNSSSTHNSDRSLSNFLQTSNSFRPSSPKLSDYHHSLSDNEQSPDSHKNSHKKSHKSNKNKNNNKNNKYSLINKLKSDLNTNLSTDSSSDVSSPVSSISPVKKDKKNKRKNKGSNQVSQHKINKFGSDSSYH